MHQRRLPLLALVTAASFLTACGDNSQSASDSVASTTLSPAEFLQEVQTLCYDIGERAYQDVQKVYAGDAAPTPALRAKEYRIRAEATDELADDLAELEPTSAFAERWGSILTGLQEYADHERESAVAVETGAEETDRPDGLNDFRDLGLGGTCNDWLDMN